MSNWRGAGAQINGQNYGTGKVRVCFFTHFTDSRERIRRVGKKAPEAVCYAIR